MFLFHLHELYSYMTVHDLYLAHKQFLILLMLLLVYHQHNKHFHHSMLYNFHQILHNLLQNINVRNQILFLLPTFLLMSMLVYLLYNLLCIHQISHQPQQNIQYFLFRLFLQIPLNILFHYILLVSLQNILFYIPVLFLFLQSFHLCLFLYHINYWFQQQNKLYSLYYHMPFHH